jgi:L-2-aminoadipate reductase
MADFFWRMVKGCIQIEFTLEIINTINMVPVVRVARCITGALLRPTESTGPFILNFTARPLVTYNALLSALPKYGTLLRSAIMSSGDRSLNNMFWRCKIMRYSPSYILFSMIFLPVQAVSILMRNGYPGGATVVDSLMGLYLAWLVAAEFLPNPPDGASLPTLTNSGQVKGIVRRVG